MSELPAGRRSGFAIAPSDGSPLFYREFGAGEPPVVLCDGIGCDGFVWKHLEDRLAARHRVIHWHYRGHGRSPRPRDGERIRTEDFADDLVAVLDDSGSERAILVGHSMGVQVVLEAFRRHPGRALGLVLVCGAPGHLLRTFRRTGGRVERMLPTVRRAIGRAPRLFNGISRAILPTRLSWSIATKVEVDPELVNPLDFMPYLRGLSRVDVDYFLQVLAHAAEHSAEDMLGTIDVPTLVIAGEKDNFTPPELSVKMAESIPNAELVRIERGTHTAPIEQPVAIGDAIERFLSDHLPRP